MQETPTLRVTSNLVFLDIVVVDKRGKLVVKGLAKDDFTISRSVDFVVELRSKALGWHAALDGKSSANLTVVAASLSDRREILASRVDRATLSVAAQDPARLAQEVVRFPLSVRMPRKTKTIRVVLQTEEAGRIGAADLDTASIETAPDVPTPDENEGYPAPSNNSH